MNIDTPEYMEYFLDLSVAVTGFSRFELEGTGQAPLYFDTVRSIIGRQMFGELLQIFHEEGLEQVLESERLGPISRNIIKLWYVATWEKLPTAWLEKFGATLNDATTFIADPYAYPEGLLWKTIGVNPPAANAPGYGTWSEPPLVSLG